MKHVLEAVQGRRRLAVLTLLVFLSAAPYAAAGPFAPTEYFGSWVAMIDAATVATGAFGVNERGEFVFAYDFPFTVRPTEGGASITFTSISGNADPSINFAVGATNSSDVSKSFGISLAFPIALSGTDVAHSALSYSVYTAGVDGAAITPTSATILTAVDRDTTPGGLGDLNKGVDIGPALSFSGGPGHVDSGLLIATNVFPVSLDYDLMVVNLGFLLSPHSGVSMAGFVEQYTLQPVPEPASLFLLGTGLGIAGLVVRRRKVRATLPDGSRTRRGGE